MHVKWWKLVNNINNYKGKKKDIFLWISFLLCKGVTIPMWIVLCRLPEKGRKKTEEIVERRKEMDREERGTGMKVKKQMKYKHSPPRPPQSLPATRIAGLAQLEANISWTPRWRKIPDTFATPNHTLDTPSYLEWCNIQLKAFLVFNKLFLCVSPSKHSL